MKDPTANAAARNVEGQRRAGLLQYREDGQPARLWLDPFTLRTLLRNGVILTDDTGERHIRLTEKAVALLEQDDRQVTSKGN